MSETCEIVFILDRSGSMQSMRSEAIGGFNAFVQDQKDVPGDAIFTLVQFDHEYEMVHDGMPLEDVPDLNDKTYVPRGTTALLDAIGRTIDDVGKRLSQTPEQTRPGKIIVAILTDGYENASKDYTQKRVGDMVKHQQDTYQWQFFFLGADMNAIAMAANLNIPKQQTQSYDATKEGTLRAYNATSSFVTHARTGDSGE